MKTSFLKTAVIAVLMALTTAVAVAPIEAEAQEKKKFRIAWSIYVGWMPWGYMEEYGIIDKWAEKYGIEIEIVQINDYVESINQYTAGEFDGVTATNMDTLSIPAGGGVDTTVLIVGDFSNGNDALLVKGGMGIADLKGKRINLVELSVSHYLLVRGLETAGLGEPDVTVVNTGDADMVAAFTTDEVEAVVTWNPLVAEIEALPGAARIFDSSDIPGEIIDLLVVNTETLAANPELGMALAGAWYETTTLMSSDTPEGAAAREAMGIASGTDLAGYEAQLASTEMFYAPADAAAFTREAKLIQTMDFVRVFLFDRGILGVGAETVDDIGISFPDGTVLGDEGNVKMRFDPSFMDKAAAGEL